MVAPSLQFCGVSFIQKFYQVLLSGGVKQERSGASHVLDLNVNNSKTIGDTSKVTIIG